MTEQEWLYCTDPAPMLRFLGDKTDKRKLRLFACACSRKAWDDSWPQRCTEVVTTAEQFADGLATEGELNHARTWACQALQRAISATKGSSIDMGRRFEFLVSFAADTALSEHKLPHRMTYHYPVIGFYHYRNDPFVVAMPAVARDIFGNPFQHELADHSWLTSTVVLLARQMYESRDFSPMPILADALQDAGCDNDEVLNHCRGPGPHVRGCWVIDLLTGRK